MKHHAAFEAYTFVRVLAHTGISQETEEMAKFDRIELFELKPCSFREFEETVKPARRWPLAPSSSVQALSSWLRNRGVLEGK